MKNIEKFKTSVAALRAAVLAYGQSHGEFLSKVAAANGRKLSSAVDAVLEAGSVGADALAGVVASMAAGYAEAAKSTPVSEADADALTEVLRALKPAAPPEDTQGKVKEEDISLEQAFQEVFSSKVREMNEAGWNTLNNRLEQNTLVLDIPGMEGWSHVTVYESGYLYVPDRIRKSTADFLRGKTALDLLTQPLPAGWKLRGHTRYVEEDDEAAE